MPDFKNYNWDVNQERAFWEKIHNQRLNFFLIFFSIIVAGAAFARSREFVIFILAVGSVVLWILTLTLISATRKVNYSLKALLKDENHPTVLVDRKAKGRIIRIFSGYVLPIFCSSIITLTCLAGVSEFYFFDFPVKPEVLKDVKENLQKGKDSLIKQIKPVQDNSKYFQSVDSVINKKKVIPIVPDTFKAKHVPKQPVTRKESSDPNFKAIDKVIKK
jgi:hypothetical protein